MAKSISPQIFNPVGSQSTSPISLLLLSHSPQLHTNPKHMVFTHITITTTTTFPHSPSNIASRRVYSPSPLPLANLSSIQCPFILHVLCTAGGYFHSVSVIPFAVNSHQTLQHNTTTKISSNQIPPLHPHSQPSLCSTQHHSTITQIHSLPLHPQQPNFAPPLASPHSPTFTPKLTHPPTHPSSLACRRPLNTPKLNIRAATAPGKAP